MHGYESLHNGRRVPGPSRSFINLRSFNKQLLVNWNRLSYSRGRSVPQLKPVQTKPDYVPNSTEPPLTVRGFYLTRHNGRHLKVLRHHVTKGSVNRIANPHGSVTIRYEQWVSTLRTLQNESITVESLVEGKEDTLDSQRIGRILYSRCIPSPAITITRRFPVPFRSKRHTNRYL